ncbi:MAG: winged helix-turn-helix domain-containing protein [Sulfurisoma sp.]|nr:winged helix-turn-helix domain-containing protein [Sulfurisoma sp.]
MAGITATPLRAEPRHHVANFIATHFLKDTMHSSHILKHLKKHGQLLDSEIATAMGISLPNVLASLSNLSDRGEISKCSVTRFNDGKPVQSTLCRISGYIPPASPGRKPGKN